MTKEEELQNSLAIVVNERDTAEGILAALLTKGNPEIRVKLGANARGKLQSRGLIISQEGDETVVKLDPNFKIFS